MWGQLHREFESHPLCIKPRLALLVLGFILGNGCKLSCRLRISDFETRIFLLNLNCPTDEIEISDRESKIYVYFNEWFGLTDKVRILSK